MDALEQSHKALLARTEAEIEGLRRQAHELKTDPRAIERVSRERYGMIRDGEILYGFRDPAASDTCARSPTKTGEQCRGARAADEPLRRRAPTLPA